MSESRLPIHPYAELFPQMVFPEFDRLCGDILLNGLQSLRVRCWKAGMVTWRAWPST